MTGAAKKSELIPSILYFLSPVWSHSLRRRCIEYTARMATAVNRMLERKGEEGRHEYYRTMSGWLRKF